MLDPVLSSRLARWRGVILWTLLLGYSGYYLCRSNLPIATPLMVADGFPLHIAQESRLAAIGDMMSWGVLFYAIGKLINGLIANLLDGRRVFLFGMVGSALCTVVFGMGSGLLVLTVAWAVNRYVQSMGWPALVKVVSRWFPSSGMGTVMGILSMSYLAGDAAARVVLSPFLGAGLRGLFLISAAMLGGLALLTFFTLRSSPLDVGLPEPEDEPAALPAGDVSTGQASSPPRAPDFWPLLSRLLRNARFWAVCVMNIGLTLIRETLNGWTPTFLVSEVGLTPGWAASSSAVPLLAGAGASLLGGWLLDRWGGRHARIMLPCLVLLIMSLLLTGLTPLYGQPVLALVLLASVYAFLLIPYTFCSGALPISLGGKQAGATACGVIDAAGYLVAVFAGGGMARLVDKLGWSAAFVVLAGAGLLTCGAVVLFVLWHPSTPSEPVHA